MVTEWKYTIKYKPVFCLRLWEGGRIAWSLGVLLQVSELR